MEPGVVRRVTPLPALHRTETLTCRKERFEWSHSALRIMTWISLFLIRLA